MDEKEYIDKSPLIRDLTAMKSEYDAITLDGIIKALKEAPAADVAPVVHGEWNEDKYPFCNVCMECGLVIDRTCIKNNSGKLNYCPNCGAKMDGKTADVSEPYVNGERKEATP